MKNTYIILTFLFTTSFIVAGQNSIFEVPQRITSSNILKTDGIIQPYLNDFLKLCKEYDIEYSDKLFKLKEIAIVDSLKVTPKGGTLGMLVRDENNQVEKIVFSWMTLLDKEILRVVAFHEFGHYFLGYKHTCKDCNSIMAEVNTSYFNIIKDWDNKVKQLFLNSPKYLKNKV